MKWVGLAVGLFVAPVALADAGYVDFDLGLISPQMLGQMPLEKVEKYNTEELGYSLLYSNGLFSCTVAVYDLGREDIPDGPSSDGIKNIFQALEIKLEKLEDDEAISDFQKRGGTTVPKKSPLKFANTVFQYSEPRAVRGAVKSIPVYESVYVTGKKNKFIEARFKFDSAGRSDARGMADELVKQLVLMLIAENSAEDLLLAACDALIHNPGSYAGQAAAQRVFEETLNHENLNIYDAFFVWPQDYSKPENADLLTAAYFAGILQVVIPKRLESGGEVEAFVAMMQAYENMRARDQIQSITQLDEWSKAPDKKILYQNLLVELGYIQGN